MNDLKKKILVEGLVNTPSLVAICGGVTALFAGLAGAGVVVAFGGFLSVVGGLGWSFTNLALNFDPIKAKILADQRKVIRAERDRRLDDLDDRLIRDRDPRDQTYLRMIRQLYDELYDDLEEGKIASQAASLLLPRIDELFQACVDDLEFSYRLWETQSSAVGLAKQRIKEQRNEIIDGVGRSVENFSEAVTSLMTLGQKRGTSVQEVSKKLDNDLAIAKRVEQRMNELEHPVAQNYEEYLQ